ncbi:hypothetical protein A9P82_01425 [Arachidicoccus ginsenosidimutans]|uniref:FkbM family methyltransferase n=1 Tax=Arachidicoccus sp. BS20 TaxID=1850526 RepID=UPI0007F0E67C|nr:FkbM family methyltransferase [Arachidicoccus sp. BS20]ANI88089.1 hypothetical protein A9P82_01425 [Arachidicoccus sp. BS20]
MKKLVKSILYKSLGQNAYLKLLHKSFFVLYDAGLLKNDEAYKFNYFVKNLVNEGDYVVDFGANLGYFAKIFSRLVGKRGKVICIEPVKPFFATLSWGLKSKKNCTLYNYALGTEEKTIEMVVPKMNGYLRTGLAHVPVNETYNANDNYTFEVEMRKGSELLKDLPRLDYLKCDIEGYEEYVLPEVKEILIKHKPTIQIETWGTHKDKVFELLEGIGYVPYGLTENKLTVVNNLRGGYDGDYLFIHNSRISEVLDKNKG